jgi:hypothetical protein
VFVSAKIGPDTPEWIESGRKVAVELCPKKGRGDGFAVSLDARERSS